MGMQLQLAAAKLGNGFVAFLGVHMLRHFRHGGIGGCRGSVALAAYQCGLAIYIAGIRMGMAGLFLLPAGQRGRTVCIAGICMGVAGLFLLPAAQRGRAGGITAVAMGMAGLFLLPTGKHALAGGVARFGVGMGLAFFLPAAKHTFPGGVAFLGMYVFRLAFRQDCLGSGSGFGGKRGGLLFGDAFLLADEYLALYKTAFIVCMRLFFGQRASKLAVHVIAIVVMHMHHVIGQAAGAGIRLAAFFQRMLVRLIGAFQHAAGVVHCLRMQHKRRHGNKHHRQCQTEKYCQLAALAKSGLQKLRGTALRRFHFTVSFPKSDLYGSNRCILRFERAFAACRL